MAGNSDEQQQHQVAPSINVTGPPTRPRLQSKATTAISLTDVHQAATATPAPSRSRAASVARSVSRFSPHSPRPSFPAEPDDKASIRSFRSLSFSPGADAESLLGDLRFLQRDDSPTRTYQVSDDGRGFFSTPDAQELLFRRHLEYEFDELEALDADNSNEESLMMRWTQKLKHYLILSSAGKPIYSRHGDDQLISNSVGVIQTLISMYEASNDTLKSFTAGGARFAILSKGHLYLAAITRIPESDTELRAQLDALYMQILSTLTLPSMQRMFLNRPSTDLRRPLEGTEILLSSLADNFTRGSPSNLLSALECLRLRKGQRDIIDRTMVKCKSPNLLYGLLVANSQLVSVIRPKKHSLHPSDLRLIFNLLFNSDGLRGAGGENWIPICLPGFNNTGFVYMYVSFIDPNEIHHSSGKEDAEHGDDRKQINDDGTPSGDVVFVLISTKKESFFELREMRKALEGELKSNSSLNSISAAVEHGRLACTDIIPGTVLRHFLYKSKANVQFFMPSAIPDFNSAFHWRRLMSLYSALHSAVHMKTSSLKVCHSIADDHVSLAWITPVFEMYCVAGPNTGRTALAQAASKLEQWARRQEERLFIVGGAVF